MAMSSSAFTGSPLRSLERGIDPGDAPSHAICSSRKISTPSCRDKSSTGSPRKSRRATSRSLARHRPPLAKCAPAGLLAKPGQRGNHVRRAKLAISVSGAQAHRQRAHPGSLFSKLSVMFRSSLDTSIKPIRVSRKSGPTQPLPVQSRLRQSMLHREKRLPSPRKMG